MIRKLRKQLRKNRGFTLVELMIVVAIVGILAALAIYGVRKYMTNAKTAEARNSLGQLGKDAVTAYFKEGMDPAVLTLGATSAKANALCADIANKVPANKTEIAGKKYQSKPEEWKTWDCLKFSMNDPQYFMYGYDVPASTTDVGGTFLATAEGDLDGDTETSTFSLEGKIQGDTASGITCTLAPNIKEDNADE